MNTFAYQRRINFRDCDPAQILFFGNVYPIAHEAFEEFVCRRLGFEWNDWFSNGSWGVPLRQSSCEYHRPMRGGEMIDVTVVIEKLGETSMTLRYRFEAGGELRAEVTLIHVFVDVAKMRKMTMPLNVRHALEAYQRESAPAN